MDTALTHFVTATAVQLYAVMRFSRQTILRTKNQHFQFRLEQLRGTST